MIFVKWDKSKNIAVETIYDGVVSIRGVLCLIFMVKVPLFKISRLFKIGWPSHGNDDFSISHLFSGAF